MALLSSLYVMLLSVIVFHMECLRFLLQLRPSKWLINRAWAIISPVLARTSLVTYALGSLKWGHTSCVKSIAVIGDHVYTGCWDFLIKKWDARSGACLLTFAGHRQDIIGIAVSGRHLFSCGDYCRLWDTQTGEQLATFGLGTYYCAIANSTHVFAARANGAIEVFAYAHASSGEVLVTGAVAVPDRVLAGHTAGVMDFELRGDLLISASIDRTARAWSVSSGEHLQTFTVRAGREGRGEGTRERGRKRAGEMRECGVEGLRRSGRQ
jgi:WD40 repeat protein